MLKVLRHGVKNVVKFSSLNIKQLLKNSLNHTQCSFSLLQKSKQMKWSACIHTLCCQIYTRSKFAISSFFNTAYNDIYLLKPKEKAHVAQEHIHTNKKIHTHINLQYTNYRCHTVAFGGGLPPMAYHLSMRRGMNSRTAGSEPSNKLNIYCCKSSASPMDKMYLFGRENADCKACLNNTLG